MRQCVRIANEILMFFRAQKKSSSDVSLSEYLETGKDGNSLSLMDVICTEEDLFDELSSREAYAKLYEIMENVLNKREKEIIALRYGLGERMPLTQREIAAKLGISRSYVSRRAYCKRCPDKPCSARACPGIGCFW